MNMSGDLSVDMENLAHELTHYAQLSPDSPFSPVLQDIFYLNFQYYVEPPNLPDGMTASLEEFQFYGNQPIEKHALTVQAAVAAALRYDHNVREPFQQIVMGAMTDPIRYSFVSPEERYILEAGYLTKNE
jgi:hypothetical protein